MPNTGSIIEARKLRLNEVNTCYQRLLYAAIKTSFLQHKVWISLSFVDVALIYRKDDVEVQKPWTTSMV